MRRRLLTEGGGYCSLNVIISTGVYSITVQGTTYRTSTTLQFPIGTEITWSARADSYYNVSPSGNQKLVLTEPSMTIAPVASFKNYPLTIIVEPYADEYIDVTINGVTTRYTAGSYTLQVPYMTEYSWVAKATSWVCVTGTGYGSGIMRNSPVTITSGNAIPTIDIVSEDEVYTNYGGNTNMTFTVMPYRDTNNTFTHIYVQCVLKRYSTGYCGVSGAASSYDELCDVLYVAGFSASVSVPSGWLNGLPYACVYIDNIPYYNV